MLTQTGCEEVSSPEGWAAGVSMSGKGSVCGGRNCDTRVPGTVREAHNSVQLNQQVYWVIQVIPYVSKGRSHRDCWYEASYGHLVNLS